MKKIYTVLLVFLWMITLQNAWNQARDLRRARGYVNPQEIVGYLDSSMRMDQALLLIGELSKQFANKIIIDPDRHGRPIGINVVKQHWRDALEMILTANGLWYKEEVDYIQVVPGGPEAGIQVPGEKGEPPPTLENRDIKISAVFFSTNVSKLQDYGISWNFFRNRNFATSRDQPELTGYLSTGIGRSDTLGFIPPSPSGSFQKALGIISSPPSFTFANVDALVRFFGANGLGEVITSPEVIVRNGKQGKIQIGKTIYITTRDFAGNAIQQPVKTGTIIDVTPITYTQADTDFVYLDLKIEQSDASAGPTISVSSVETHVLLYDGEETVIGGLYSTLDQETREGIPILKDLPPWFFGLRYLFGSESKIKTKSELIILLKVELLPAIRARISVKEARPDILKEKRKEFQRELEKK